MNVDKNDDVRSENDIEKYIISLLKNNDKLTTKEIVELTEAEGLTCPDEPVRFLNKMRLRGLIKGELSLEKKGWHWWI